MAYTGVDPGFGVRGPSRALKARIVHRSGNVGYGEGVSPSPHFFHFWVSTLEMRMATKTTAWHMVWFTPWSRVVPLCPQRLCPSLASIRQFFSVGIHNVIYQLFRPATIHRDTLLLIIS